MREQKDAEREVRRAVTLLQSTLDSTADGILVIGDGGRILTYNQRFAEMWRIPAAADRERRRPRRSSTACSISSSIPITSCARSKRSTRSRRRRASTCSSSRTAGASSATRSAARVEGVANVRVWSFRDVTARFTAEAALRESELRYRLLFEQNAAGVCVTELDGDDRRLQRRPSPRCSATRARS